MNSSATPSSIGPIEKPPKFYPAEDVNLATGKKSLLHAALKFKDTNVLDDILKKFPSLVKERDEEGRTCLSIAASAGFCEGICKLLDTSMLSIFVSDDDGSFPILMAAEKGHTHVIKELLNRFPYSIQQINKKGQNIFHIVARYGKSGVAELVQSHIAGHVQSIMLEKQDDDGNTPLHVATMNWRPKVLLTFKRNISKKALKIKNSLGLTPLDIAEMNLQSSYVFRERMTLMVLLKLYNLRFGGISFIPMNGWTLRNRSEKLGGGGIEKHRDSLDVLLLVATLLNIMTVAALFRMSGVFSSSVSNAGASVSTFIVCDGIAFLSSLLAMTGFMSARLGNGRWPFHLALPALMVGLLFIGLAFVSGMSEHIRTYQNTVARYFSIGGSIAVGVFTSLLSPYLIHQVYGVPVIQNITAVYLYMIVKWMDTDEDNDETYPKESQ